METKHKRQVQVRRKKSSIKSLTIYNHTATIIVQFLEGYHTVFEQVVAFKTIMDQ